MSNKYNLTEKFTINLAFSQVYEKSAEKDCQMCMLTTTDKYGRPSRESSIGRWWFPECNKSGRGLNKALPDG